MRSNVAGLQNAFFVGRVELVGLVGCAVEFLGRIGLGIGVDFGCWYDFYRATPC